MRKEFIHIVRDPRSLYLAIGIPILLMILFGYAITFDIKEIPLAIFDLDDTPLSRKLVSSVHSCGYFDLVQFSRTYAGAEELLDSGRAKVVIVIPHHFSRDLSLGQDAPIQLLVDGSDNNTALIALSYISNLVYTFSSNIILEKLERSGAVATMEFPPLRIETRAWYNPGLNSTHFIVPGLIAVVMMIMAAMLTSLTVAREWEIGTMEQLIATPVKPHEIIIGKLLPYFFLGIVQITLIVLTGVLWFKTPLKGNLLLLGVATGIFLTSGLGLGLLISTVTKSQQLAFMLSVIFTFLPSFLLSGFIFPIASMPKVIRFITHIVPAKYFLVILRGIFLKGSGYSLLFPELLTLALLGLLIIFACAQRLKLRLK